MAVTANYRIWRIIRAERAWTSVSSGISIRMRPFCIASICVRGPLIDERDVGANASHTRGYRGAPFAPVPRTAIFGLPIPALSSCLHRVPRRDGSTTVGR